MIAPVTLGVALGSIALSLAFGAAAIRTRDRFWAIVSVVVLVPLGYRLAQRQIDPSRIVASSDGDLVTIGLLLLAVMVVITMALPTTVQKRVVYGPANRELVFERALLEARQPFVRAASVRAASVGEEARWASQLGVDPPTAEWASLTRRIAAQDEEWAQRVRVGSSRDEWLGWEAANDQLLAEWKDLSGRASDERLRRYRWAARLVKVAFAAAAVLLFIGLLGLTSS